MQPAHSCLPAITIRMNPLRIKFMRSIMVICSCKQSTNSPENTQLRSVYNYFQQCIGLSICIAIVECNNPVEKLRNEEAAKSKNKNPPAEPLVVQKHLEDFFDDLPFVWIFRSKKALNQGLRINWKIWNSPILELSFWDIVFHLSLLPSICTASPDPSGRFAASKPCS